MTGEAVRQIFGDDMVGKVAQAAARDAAEHISAGEFVAAAFSASHFVRLMNERPWGEEAQTSMAGGLKSEIEDDLREARDAVAASRAATYQMLTGESPWSGEKLQRMLDALSPVPESPGAYGE